jgi:4-hydroxy-tetrahydrodipicolinate synthase
MLGSLGENVTLDPQEKRAVMDTPSAPPAAVSPSSSGVAETTTAAAVRYVREMEKLHADGVMVLPRWSTSPTRARRSSTSAPFARATSLPVIVYNNPVPTASTSRPRCSPSWPTRRRWSRSRSPAPMSAGSRT